MVRPCGLLKRTPPDLEEAEFAVSMMIDDSHRASQIFDNIRTLFGKAELTREQVDLNSLES